MKRKLLAVLCLMMVLCLLPLQGLAVKEGQLVRITNSGSLNVRSGPGTSYDVIGKANFDNIYPYLGTVGDWHHIRYTLGVTGYVSASRTTLEDGLVQDELSDGNEVDAVIRITHTNTLNIRKGPAKSYDVISVAKPNETYPYVGPDNGWYIIELPSGEFGYVAANRSEIEVRGYFDEFGHAISLAPVVTAKPTPTPRPTATPTPRPTATPFVIATAIPYYTAAPAYMTCGQCGGDGLCTTCDGAGVVYGALQKTIIYCPSCLGNSICWICNGTGMQQLH